MNTAYAAKPSGKTPTGKAISARNATSHGVFCRQTVLPHLGEDPAGYKALLDTLNEQLRPRNLMEQQYIELWTEASWKLRRLSRFEAQIWEDDGFEEDARLTKIERLMRVQTTLRRQMDKAVCMLSQTVPNLFAHRTREDVQQKMNMTDMSCSNNSYNAGKVEIAVLNNLHWPLNESFPASIMGNRQQSRSPRRKKCRKWLKSLWRKVNQRIAKNELLVCGSGIVGAQHAAPLPGEANPAESSSESKNCKNELVYDECKRVPTLPGHGPVAAILAREKRAVASNIKDPMPVKGTAIRRERPSVENIYAPEGLLSV